VEKAKYHLIGVIVHGIGSWVYTMSDKWKSDANVTIEVLQRVLTAIEEQRGGLPSTLYVQMDNCTRENKNKWVLAYLSWLVQRGVFETIELSFLPVGHTHEDIDQLFSRLAVYLRGHDAIDRTMLYEGIRKAFHQFGHTPICSHLESVACLRSLLEPHMLEIGNHAGREVQHFLFKPHRNGASMFTKSQSYDVPWDVYDSPSRDADDRGFHLLLPSAPSPPFAAAVRPGPSAPKPPVFPKDTELRKNIDITAYKISQGLQVIAADSRVSAAQLSSLLRDYEDFKNRAPVAFNWPNDGQFAKERRAASAILDPDAVAGVAGAAAAAAAAVVAPFIRISSAEAARHKEVSSNLEIDRALYQDGEINKFYAYQPNFAFLSEHTPAAKAAAAARGASSSSSAAAAAAGSGLRHGALFDAAAMANHSREVTYQNKVRKLFPSRLEVGHFVVLQPRLDGQPEVAEGAQAAAAATAVVTAPALPTHRQSTIPRTELKSARKAAAAKKDDHESEEDYTDRPAASKRKKKKGSAGLSVQKKRKSATPASNTDVRPFWLGKVLKFNRNDGWIRFHDWTPYISRDGVNRDKIGNAFEGNYFPDKKHGEPVVNWAQWHPTKKDLLSKDGKLPLLWTFFTPDGMSNVGNLTVEVKQRLQEIIQTEPPVRQKLARGKGKGHSFPDAPWTAQEWPAEEAGDSDNDDGDGWRT